MLGVTHAIETLFKHTGTNTVTEWRSLLFILQLKLKKLFRVSVKCDDNNDDDDDERMISSFLNVVFLHVDLIEAPDKSLLF